MKEMFRKFTHSPDGKYRTGHYTLSIGHERKCCGTDPRSLNQAVSYHLEHFSPARSTAHVYHLIANQGE